MAAVPVDVLTSAEVAAAVGVTTAKVIRWTNDGALHHVMGGGTGCPFLYPPSELHVARVLARWRAVVSDPDTLSTLAHAARAQRGEDDRSIVAAVIADSVIITFTGEP